MDESEKELQDYFINLLINNGYDEVIIKNEADLISNFKKQLQLFNKDVDFDFESVLNYIYQGDRDLKFDKLRNTFNGVRFIDFSDFSHNIFQVSQEISVSGEYTNRYDVTLLINGLPLVQIELKRSGGEIREAFNQIWRYKNQSYSRLFDLIQVFVISNKVNTRYFFNDNILNYNLTGNWGDSKDLTAFANSFLIRKNLMRILSDYIFKNSSGTYQMLRPYQITAVEGVLKSITDNRDGYVWMSPSTGKSTAALRLAEILKKRFQVIYITTGYPDKYPESLTVQNNGEFLDAVGRQDLIITNIRSILSKPDNLDEIRHGKFVFIFNEYEKHSPKYSPDKLMEIFTNSLFYCFTSAPVFDENIILDRNTKSFFKNQISAYTLKDAIRDKTTQILDCEFIGDENITCEYDLSSDSRIREISDYIISDNASQSVLITSSNADLLRYYGYIKESDMRVVPVLRHDANDIFESKPMRDYFEEYIREYNHEFTSNIRHKKVVDTTVISREFELDVIKRFNLGEIDLLVVDEAVFYDKYRVNLLRNLTKTSLNTIYLDCNLNYDTLLEALMMAGEVDFSGEKDSNIKMFRDLRENIKKTVKLYSDNHPSEKITLRDYNHYLERYTHYLALIGDDFCVNFKKLSNCYSILRSFDEFDFTNSQNDEFNSLKDRFEHEIYEMNSAKRTIHEYEPQILDRFLIDLNYIEEGEVKADSQGEGENNTFNILTQTNNNLDYRNTDVLSLQNHDNSQKVSVVNNNQDMSRNISVKNEYHIHIGGDNIQKTSNNHFKAKTGEKFCIVCQEAFPESFNYCPNHEDDVELHNMGDLTKMCRSCRSKYPDEYNYCPNCDCDEELSYIYTPPKIINIETLPNSYFNFHAHANRYGEIDDLLAPKNIEKLKEFNLDEIEFDNIISHIKSTSAGILENLIDTYHIDTESLSPLDRIILFSKSFVKTQYKEGGGDLGYFNFNEIRIDDRATKALQITTIIHELSHFLLSEILEQIVSLSLNTDKTDAVEAFVCYQLCNDEFNYVVDEYCAHTVEGRFATYGYQDYGSYNRASSNLSGKYSPEHVEVARNVGNTFADYIKDIMTSYIDYDLREDIKEEFTKINDPPKYDGVSLETSEKLNWDGFSKAIRLMLTMNIDDIQNSPEDMSKLNEFAVKFRINNQGQ